MIQSEVSPTYKRKGPKKEALEYHGFIEPKKRKKGPDNPNFKRHEHSSAIFNSFDKDLDPNETKLSHSHVIYAKKDIKEYVPKS